MKNEIIKTLPFGPDVRVVTTDVQLTPEIAAAVRQSWDVGRFPDRDCRDVERIKLLESGDKSAKPWWNCRVRDLQVSREQIGFRPAPQMSAQAMNDHGKWSLIAPAGMIPVLAAFFRNRYACPTLVLTSRSPVMGEDGQVAWGKIARVLNVEPRDFFVHLFAFDDLVRLHASTVPTMNGRERSLMANIDANTAAIASTVQLPANNGTLVKPFIRISGNVVSENLHKAELANLYALGTLIELSRETNQMLRQLLEQE